MLQAERYGGTEPTREQLERWQENALLMLEKAEADALNLMASDKAKAATLRDKIGMVATASMLLGSIQADLFEGRTAPKVSGLKVSEPCDALVAAAEQNEFHTLVSALGTLKLTELVGVRETCRITKRATWFRHRKALIGVGLKMPAKPSDATWSGGKP